ncbi:MAG: hypothetical protein FWF28_00600 [Micrococcales bacterium]|nr:hypothetical protein [Micrococcales bacterium]
MSAQTMEPADVAGYAAAVRRALTGLDREQADDLTDGLEANLAEALADEANPGRGTDPVSRFGTPEEYAAELGAAAGLDVPAAAERPWRFRDDLGHPIRALRRFGRTLLARLRTRPWWPPLERFFVALRPVWWVLRGWVLYQNPVRWWRSGPLLPNSFPRWVLLLVLLVASVQWGRGAWRMPRGWRWLPVLASVAAVIGAVPVLITVSAAEEFAGADAWATPVDNVLWDRATDAYVPLVWDDQTGAYQLPGNLGLQGQPFPAAPVVGPSATAPAVVAPSAKPTPSDDAEAGLPPSAGPTPQTPPTP